MLDVQNMDVFYGAVQVLYGVTFHIENGSIVGLLGSNGAGKTTTIKTLSGQIHPRAGMIIFEGRNTEKIPAYKLVELGMVQVPEGRKIFPFMTVLENLELGSYTLKAKQKRLETLAFLFHLFPVLEARKKQIAGTLSGGEQQMLAIGRGLMALPKLLALDEPSLGLAPLVVKRIFDTVRRVNEKGTTILLVEQNVKEALLLSHSAYVLENGRVVLAGEGSELANDERIKKAYIGI